MRLEFLGAAHVVTGSCYLIHVGDHRYLVDCGMYQGTRRLREMNYEDFPFNPAEIEAVFLTHAHIDHCGRIPRLVREGFRGKIYATRSTCDLVRIMLPDSAHIQESDAELFNRKNARRSEAPITPLYTQADAFAALELFEPVAYQSTLQVDDLRLTFRDAGHILGSAILEIVVEESGQETKLVFSGDLGQPNQPILRDPDVIEGADFVLVESTYGDRIHRDYDKETALLEVIRDTMDRGGNVIIPSFAVGRTQTLLYYFYNLWKAGRLDGDIPIIIDSPLAIQATRVFLKNYEDFDEETIAFFGEQGTIPAFPQVRIAETAAESRALNSAEGSAIILSASGMAGACCTTSSTISGVPSPRFSLSAIRRRGALGGGSSTGSSACAYSVRRSRSRHRSKCSKDSRHTQTRSKLSTGCGRSKIPVLRRCSSSTVRGRRRRHLRSGFRRSSDLRCTHRSSATS